MTLYGVGLGPGDAGLLTVRGREILESADVVYTPGRLSRAVATEYVDDDQLGDPDFPMTRDEEKLRRAWKAAAWPTGPSSSNPVGPRRYWVTRRPTKLGRWSMPRPHSTMTDQSTSTTASFDVTIIGAGPAGAAAGVFCARAGLDTVVVENGRSTLQKCAFVENYMGFPAGLPPSDLLALCRAHVAETDCELREATVAAVDTVAEGFELATEDGQRLRSTFVVAASWSESDYLEALGVETEQEPDGPIQEIQTDRRGETNVDGLYAAGRITGTHHQALVSAGDGARVALNLVERAIPAYYNDWVAPEGYYANYDREVPVGVEEIDHEERQRRVRRGRRWMCEFFEA